MTAHVGTGARPSHAYAAAGTYDVTLTVTDDDGDRLLYRNTVTITDQYGADTFGRTVTNRFRHRRAARPWTVRPRARQNFSVER